MNLNESQYFCHGLRDSYSFWWWSFKWKNPPLFVEEQSHIPWQNDPTFRGSYIQWEEPQFHRVIKQGHLIYTIIPRYSTSITMISNNLMTLCKHRVPWSIHFVFFLIFLRSIFSSNSDAYWFSLRLASPALHRSSQYRTADAFDLKWTLLPWYFKSNDCGKAKDFIVVLVIFLMACWTLVLPTR